MAVSKLNPRKTSARQGEPTTTPSWAAIVAALFAIMGFLTSAVSLIPGTADMNINLAVYVGSCFGLAITFALLALGDRG